MLLHFGKQDFIAQNMPNNAIPNLNTCNRSYSASLKQREFLCRSILKSPIHQVVLNGKDIPKKIHHEFLRCFLPLAGFDRNLVSSIQIVGVTDNLLIVHKSLLFIHSERTMPPSLLVKQRIRTNSIRVRSVVVVRIAIVVHISEISRRNDA